MPLVSVILPTFARNASGLLRNSILSVLSQHFKDFELLIVDDGSTDGSAETISELAAQDARVTHIRFERNIGLPAYTSVEALKRSSGDYIAWQFDDCAWLPHHLTTLLDGFKKNPAAGVTYGQTTMKFATDDFVLGSPFDASKLREMNFIPNCAAVIKREVIRSIGWFDPSILLKRICDYDFWCRVSEHFPFEFCNQLVAVENGLLLPDSLGNSVTLASKLSSKYRSQNRNDYLKVNNFANWDPFTAPAWMDEDEKEEFCFLVFEHFLRIRQVLRGARAVKAVLPSKFTPEPVFGEEEENASLVAVVFRWYAETINKSATTSRADLQLEILHLHRYIDRQDQQIQNRLRASIVKRVPAPLVGWLRNRGTAAG